MRNTLIAFLVVLCSCVPAFSQQQLDAATKEDVEQLLELSGARARVQQLWAGMAKQAATTAADAYRDKHPDATPLQLRQVADATGEYMKEVTNSFSVDELMEAIVPVYQRHLSHADVRSIIDFYNTPAGQKLLKETPAMMSESMQATNAIVQKHLPEMEAAAEKMMEKAAKAASPSNDKKDKE